MPQTPQQYLDQKVQEILDAHGVPAIAAVLVRDGGNTKTISVKGVRKWDVSHTAPGNQIQLHDRFSLGSVSKPVTGYLAAYLVQTGSLSLGTTIRQVFPEFQNSWCRRGYGMRDYFLEKTVEQLMCHMAELQYAPLQGYESLFGNFTPQNTSGYSNEAAEMFRRYLYTIVAQQDPELPSNAPPGERYSGGCIIVAAMAERLLNLSYQKLLKTHVFTPLGMNDSGVGRLCTSSAPDGTWQHSWMNSQIVPAQFAMTPQFDFHSHNPAGAVYMSAPDAAKFIEANLSENGKPKLVASDEFLRQSHALGSPVTNASKGGWGISGNKVWHNGDNGASYAYLRVTPSENWGAAAFTNVSSGQKGQLAVDETISALRTMHQNWATLFP